jgi:hypothetical protein
VRFRSFKLRFVDRRVRAVPLTDARGCPFAGPGVDVLGEEAESALAAAGPLVDALAAVEPGIVVRAVSVDLERPRVTASLEPQTAADPRPRVVRIDEGGLLESLLEASRAVEQSLSAPVAAALAGRR